MGESCQPNLAEARRSFWATQANACGSDWDDCKLQNCGRPGLRIIPAETANEATISTENWVAGLILNILFTRATNNATSCAIQPGNRGGHWTDSFTGNQSGSTLQNLQINSSPQRAIPTLKSAIEFDLQKLISFGICDRIEAVVTYQGRGQYNVVINAYGNKAGTDTGLTLSGSTQNNMWRWDN